MPHILSCQEGSMTSYVPAFSGPHRFGRCVVLTTEIIRLIVGTNRDDAQNGPASVFRSVVQPDDLVMDHVDTASCQAAKPKVSETEKCNDQDHH
jgi:hypothetical protein